jgi:hypothetical protein
VTTPLAFTTAGQLSLAVHNSPLGQVIRRDFDCDPVAGDDADEILAHLAGDMGEDAMAVLELDHELGVGKRLHDAPFGTNRFLFGHSDLLHRRPQAAAGRLKCDLVSSGSSHPPRYPVDSSRPTAGRVGEGRIGPE